MGLRRLIGIGLPCAFALFAPPATAGLSLEAMQTRHRALIDRAEGRTPTADAYALPTTRLTLQAGRRAANAPALLGETIVGGSGVQLSHALLERDGNRFGIELRAGLVARDDDGRLRPEGSALSAPVGYGELYVSYERRHWGPAWFGSLMLDQAAFPLAAGGWRSSAALDEHSRWQWDVFAGTLEGHVEPQRPHLIGMRLEWRPTAAWAVGLSRTLQWGGVGRDESLKSLGRALLGSDNVGRSGVDAQNEPGNQLAGLDVRYDVEADNGALVGGYFQLAAEDKATYVPSRRLQLVGLDIAIPTDAAGLRAIVELAKTTAGKAPGLAYVHRAFARGYTQRGQPLGHPIGGDSRLNSVGLLIERGTAFALLALHHGRALTGAQRFSAGKRLQGIDASISFVPYSGVALGVSAHSWRAGAQRDEAAQLWLRFDRW